MKASFLRAFPTPAYLAPPALGIDISDEGIKYAELLRTPHGLRLGRYGETPFPFGVVEKGIIQQPDAVSGALKEIHQKLRLRTAFISIMEGQGYLVRLRIPKDAAENIRGAIELQLEEHIPLSPAEILFDYEIVREPSAGNDFFDVGVSALPRSAVEVYCETIALGEFEPLAFEIESHSIARAVLKEGEQGAFMLIDIGRLRTGVVIVSDGVVAFTSTIDVGGDSFTKVLERDRKISYEAAEQLKKEKGISRSLGGDDLFSSLASVLSALKEEAARHLAYWETHVHESGESRKKIQSVFLSGGGANTRGLADYLSGGLGFPVSIANPWVNVFSFADVVPEMSRDMSLAYTTAIGLALRAFDAERSYVLHL